MSLGLPSSTADLFASVRAASTPTPTPTIAAVTPHSTQNITLGSIFSAVLRDDPKIKAQMTPAEQNAVAAVIKNVGTPDEYGSSMEYVLRALPYVRAVYSTMNMVEPDMPTTEEIAILMRSRYLN